MSTFARVVLERYSDELAPEQIEAMAVWEEKLCKVSAADGEAASARRAAALVCVKEFFATFADEIAELQRKNFREVVMSNQAHSYAEWMRAQNFFVRDFQLLTVEESDVLGDWELVLCDTSVAFLPRLERSFARVTAFVAEHSEQLRAQNKKALVDTFGSKDMQPIPMWCFCRLFVKRYLHRLSGQQVAEVEEWECDLCVFETELVDKFLSVARLIWRCLAPATWSSYSAVTTGKQTKIYDLVWFYSAALGSVSAGRPRTSQSSLRAAGAEGGANACEDCSRCQAACGRDCFRESAAVPKASQEPEATVWE